jgi:hypothetical protein
MVSKDTDLTDVFKTLFSVVPGNSSMNQNGKSCLSCAIVGNSGNLLGSGYGTLIDSKDVIIRINKAPVKGYEKDVGNRTTHQIIYPESATGYRPGASLLFLPFKPNDIKWLLNIFTDKKPMGQDIITDKNLSCQIDNFMIF